jgi:hypothetical protein
MARKSRYPRSMNPAQAAAGVPTRVRTMAGPDGNIIRYHARRILPLPETLATHGVYVVRPGDRIDLVATRLIGDPLLYWRLADVNDTPDPMALCAPGRRLRIPAPLGDVAPDPFGLAPAMSGSAAAAPVTDERDEDEPAEKTS